MLHRVLPKYDAENYYFQRNTAISWSRFVSLLDHIETNGFTTQPISKLTTSTAKTDVFITFDDGYADNKKALNEILSRGMTATIFPVKDFIQHNFSVIDDMAHHLMYQHSLQPVTPSLQQSLQTGRLKKLLRNLTPSRYRFLRRKWFNINQDANTKKLFMSESEIINFCRQGIELGIHGCSHRTFSALTQRELLDELLTSLTWLNSLGGKSFPPICFPHGKHNLNVINLSLSIGMPLLGVDCDIHYPQVLRRIHYKERQNA